VHRRAFTIIELLVAATITAILAGLMLTVVVNVLNSWTRSHGSLEAEAQARFALDQLTTDLQGALFRSDGNVWLAATVVDNTATSGKWTAAAAGAKPSSLDVMDTRNGLAAPGQFADARFGIAGVWLRFITARPAAQATPAAPAAPVAVGYQLIRRVPLGATAGEAHYMLYRAEVSPTNTFTAGYNLDPATGGYLAASDVDGNAGNLIKPPELRVIADNVVDFGLRLYTRNAATGALTLVYPVNATDLQHLAKAPPTAATVADRFPEVADVMLRVLTAEGARQISALEAGQIKADWWTIVAANSKVFTRRIVLNASPL
jgi:prepilin-type N-terminal cleavage/methylation domain-containing protein